MPWMRSDQLSGSICGTRQRGVDPVELAARRLPRHAALAEVGACGQRRRRLGSVRGSRDRGAGRGHVEAGVLRGPPAEAGHRGQRRRCRAALQEAHAGRRRPARLRGGPARWLAPGSLAGAAGAAARSAACAAPRAAGAACPIDRSGTTSERRGCRARRARAPRSPIAAERSPTRLHRPGRTRGGAAASTPTTTANTATPT